jgi:heme-degrading monooxygenase HmoA
MIDYYAVIFTSVRTEVADGYAETAEEMLRLAALQDGFLGVESARDSVGITVSYWRDVASIAAWRKNMEHSLARENGRLKWYQSFKVRICKVEREYDWSVG